MKIESIQYEKQLLIYEEILKASPESLSRLLGQIERTPEGMNEYEKIIEKIGSMGL